MKLRLATSVALFLTLTACGESQKPVSLGPDPTAPVLPIAKNCASPQSWIGGITELCNGKLVYRDYIYDDHGASDTTFNGIGALSSPAGNKTYPAGQGNTADLVELQLSINGDQLHVRALLNTLFDAKSTLLGVTIDTDNNANTGGGSWAPLVASSQGWEVLKVFDTGDPETNLIEGDIPLPSSGKWRIQAALAKADGTVMNVAFRGPNEGAAGVYGLPPGKGVWFEDKQALALMNGDISEFGAEVNVADLKAGVTRAADEVGPGLHERVYVSDYTVPPGEGTSCVAGRGDGGGTLSIGFEQEFCFLGRYQPYGIYVPNKPGPHGMQMAFHGSGANLASLINAPGMQQAFGEGVNRIIVVPSARGPDGYGSDFSERDLLDVMDDVERNYPIDLDRVFAGGYSQGGYITYRMAALYPQRFAGLVNWVGFPGNLLNTPAGELPITYTAGGVGDNFDLFGSLIHIPAALIYAAADELVPISVQVPIQQAFENKGTAYEYFLHAPAEHLTFVLLDQWEKEAAYTKDLVRVKNPAHVIYRTADFLGNAALEIVHDRAYWVSEIRGSNGDPQAFQDVDFRSYGCGKSEPQFSASGQGNGTGPVPWVSTFIRQIGETPVAADNRLDGTLSNVSSLTIDAAGACLSPGTKYHISSDSPVVIKFSDGRVLTLAAGDNSGVI